MTKLILWLITFQATLVFSQTKKSINIKPGTLTCGFRSDLRPDVESAFKLMSLVYSSREFQDSIAKLTFPDNGCKYCGIHATLTGDSVLKTLFRRSSETWDLVIEKESGALGRTVPGESFTTAYYSNICSDMCNLPFKAGLAINLCHEYMHHICFCHPRNPKDVHWRKPSNGNKCDDELYDPVNYENDVAYRTGWIAYDILSRWYRNGRLKEQ